MCTQNILFLWRNKKDISTFWLKSIYIQKVLLYHNFAMLDNKQSQIHFKFNSVRVVLFVVSCTKTSCRLSKQWRPWSDATLILRRLIWVYTVCQAQKYLIWTQTVVTLIRLGVLIWVYTVCKFPQNAFGQNDFKFRGCQFCFVLFDVSLQNKILHCKWTVTPRPARLIRVYAVCQNPKKCLWTDPSYKIIWNLGVSSLFYLLYFVSLQKFLALASSAYP